MKTLEAKDYGFLTYEPNNTTTIRMSTSVLPASTSEKNSKPKRKIPFKKKNKRISQLPSDSEEEEDDDKEENIVAIKYNKNKNSSIQLKSKPGRQQIQQKNKKKIVPQLSSESSDNDNYSEYNDDDNDDDDYDDKNNKENILLRGRLINLPTTDLNIDFGSLALNSKIINKNPNTINNNSNARNINTKKKSKIIVAEENESSEEEDVDNIMNRPRKVFKPTKKSDKKIIPTNQILVNKSSDLSSSDDQNSNQEEEFNNNNNKFNSSSSDEEPLAVLMDENINPNHYVRGGNNNNFNFNNFNPHPRSPSPNQFRPLSYLSAREQELLARETGSPLINLPEKPKSPQTGLIGAIAAREVRRRSLGQGALARQAEAEREREREHRLMEQRQQLLIAERDHSLYNRPGGPGNGGGGSDFRSNRFISNQPHYDLAPINSQRNFYNEGYGYADDDDDDDDDVPLGISSNIIHIQKQQQHQFQQHQFQQHQFQQHQFQQHQFQQHQFQQHQRRLSRNQKIRRHDYE